MDWTDWTGLDGAWVKTVSVRKAGVLDLAYPFVVRLAPLLLPSPSPPVGVLPEPRPGERRRGRDSRTYRNLLEISPNSLRIFGPGGRPRDRTGVGWSSDLYGSI